MELGNFETEDVVQEKEEAVEEVEREDEIDFTTVDTYKDMIINIEQCHSVVVDKIFDPNRMLFKVGATGIINIDGETYKDRTASLSLASIDELLTYMDRYANELFEKATFIDTLEEIPFDYKKIYESEEVIKEVVKNSKIVLTFKDHEIDGVYAYKIKNKFAFLKTISTMKNIIDSKKSEMLQNSLMHSFTMMLGQIGQSARKTPGGILTPT